MKRALLFFAGSLFATVAVVAALLGNGVSLSLATPWIEKYAGERLGREVTLGSAPRLQLGRALSLKASDISVSNPDWTHSEKLLQLDAVEIRVTASSLYRHGPVLIEDVILQGLQLHIEQDGEGRSNLPQLKSQASDMRSGDEDDAGLPFVLRRASVSEVTVTRSNHANGVDVNLVIASLTQSEPSEETLTASGRGRLQDRDWTLDIDGSGLTSLITGKNLFAKFKGSLGELELVGDYAIPDLDALHDMRLHATLQGPIPGGIAALSPLLEAQEPAQVTLKVTDIDPGLGVHLLVNLAQLDITVDGSIDRPGSGDGLNAAISLDAGSLPTLARALNLGKTADVPLNISGQLAREGDRIELRELNVTAGEHRIQGSLLLPTFPDTDNAVVDFVATGPELSFYEPLLNRAATLNMPYALSGKIRTQPDDKEIVNGSLQLGEHRLRLEGLLDNFPSYSGSSLTFSLDSPDLSVFSKTAGMSLPQLPLLVDGALEVSKDAVIKLTSVTSKSHELSARLSGRLNSYPDFDDIDLHLDVEVTSLATLAPRFGLKPLGAVPMALSLQAQGSPQDLLLRNAQASAGGLNIRSTEGAIRVSDGKLGSDMRLGLSVENLQALLGSYGSRQIPSERISFDLLPRVSPELFSVSLESLQGPGVSGDALFEVTPDFTVNEKTLIFADLRLASLAKLLPRIKGYTPPTQPFFLTARTQLTNQGKTINAELGDANGPLLSGQLTIPNADAPQDILASVQGSGTDLRALGTHMRFPDEALPFALGVEASFIDDVLSVHVGNLQLAGTTLNGTASWNPASRSLSADVRIPEGRLDPWFEARPQSESEEATQPPTSRGDRLIPDNTLAFGLFDDYSIELQVETGPLGISDPRFKTASLIDELRFQFRSGSGQGQLNIDTMRGSRGALDADLTIVRRADATELSTRLAIRDLPFGLISTGTSLSTLPQYNADATFSSIGSTPRELAATLDGELLLTGGTGTLEKMSLGFATQSFIAQLFSTLLPMLDEAPRDMQAECSVLALRANAGVVSLDPGFVFRTERVDISARGAIDLRSEKLRVRFDNQARKGLGISAASLVNPYVEISGTLAKPALGLDVKSSAIAGGAAVASGGLTVLAKPLYGRFLNRKNPCETALSRWKKQSA